MGDAIFDKDGKQIYGGRGRPPKDLKSRIKAGECYHKKGKKLVPIVEEKSEDDIKKEIETFLKEKQKSSRDNCSTCKNFSIPVDKWPRKREGKCSKHDKDVRGTHWCKDFARPGQQTDQEKWDSLPLKKRQKIIKEHEKIRKRLKDAISLLEKDYPEKEKDNILVWRKKEKLPGNKIELVKKYAEMLEKRYLNRKHDKIF